MEAVQIRQGLKVHFIESKDSKLPLCSLHADTRSLPGRHGRLPKHWPGIFLMKWIYLPLLERLPGEDGSLNMMR